MYFYLKWTPKIKRRSKYSKLFFSTCNFTIQLIVTREYDHVHRKVPYLIFVLNHLQLHSNQVIKNLIITWQKISRVKRLSEYVNWMPPDSTRLQIEHWVHLHTFSIYQWQINTLHHNLRINLFLLFYSPHNQAGLR